MSKRKVCVRGRSWSTQGRIPAGAVPAGLYTDGWGREWDAYLLAGVLYLQRDMLAPLL
jgi:hypothetical protein